MEHLIMAWTTFFITGLSNMSVFFSPVAPDDNRWLLWIAEPITK